MIDRAAQRASHPVVVAHGLVQSLVQLAALTVRRSACGHFMRYLRMQVAVEKQVSTAPLSGLTFLAASCIPWTRNAASCSVMVVWAPMVPLEVRPMCGTKTSAPALAMSAAWSVSNPYGAGLRGEQ